MHFFSNIAVGLFVAAASAKQIMVEVGQGEQLIFSPNSTTASPGDTVRFHWGGGFHAVASGEFNAPCKPNDVFESAAQMSGAMAQDFIVNITSSNTTWVYCPVGKHCELGMAMVINPSTASGAPSLMQYVSNAKAANSSSAMVTGGMLVSATPSSSMAGSSSMAPSATSMAASSSSSHSNQAGSLGAGAGAIAAAALAFAL